MKRQQDIENLREICAPLMQIPTLKDSKRLLQLFIDYLFSVIHVRPEEQINSQADADATMINQMIFTKLTHLNKILEGVGYETGSGDRLNPIIDPTIVAAMIRNVYETVCLFHLIYARTKTEDEKQLIYKMWVSSGLKYRQKFEGYILTEEIRRKQREELAAINSIKTDIEAMPIYLALSAAEKEKIQKQLRDKDFRIYFEGSSLKICKSWQKTSELMGLNQSILGAIYSYFSLYAHPSQVAVFQFADMFGKANPAFPSLVNSNMKILFALLSSFVADYISLFPNVKDHYEKMPLVNQVVLNFHNMTLRDDSYSINDAWKALN